MMQEYKVCFHMSYVNKYYGTTWKHNGKMHYVGRDLEEAVEKVRGHVAAAVHTGGKCTSMWVMRGRDKGLNIKWDEYHKKGEPKKRWAYHQAEIAKIYGRAQKVLKERKLERVWE